MREFEPLPRELNAIGRVIYDSLFEVHRHLGPGLLESVYETCLIEELTRRGVAVQTQVFFPVVYKEQELKKFFRIDLLVGGCVVVELKAIDALGPIHEAQLLTYLKLSGLRLGYLVNFNTVLIKDGIRRLVL